MSTVWSKKEENHAKAHFTTLFPGIKAKAHDITRIMWKISSHDVFVDTRGH